MDKFIIDLKNKLIEVECKVRYSFDNRLWITSKEGINYAIRIEWEKNYKMYFLENDYFRKRAKIGNYSFKSEHFDEHVVIEMFEYFILLNDLYYSEFKIGMNYIIDTDINLQSEKLLKDKRYTKIIKNIEVYRCVAYLLKKGKEFSSKYPLPEVVEKQYEDLKDKTIENITIDKIKEFMQKNKCIHTYLDEHKITDNTQNLKGIREIEYSYGHIVAKSYTYKISMNLLPLEADIIIFDKEGINEIASCNVKAYKEIYKKKMLEELFNQIKNFEEDRNYIIEGEQNEK